MLAVHPRHARSANTADAQPKKTEHEMIARDLGKTKEVELKSAEGAKFVIGMIDSGTFRQLMAKLGLAKRLLIGDRDLTKENLKDVLGKMEENTLVADEKLHDTFVEFVRYGVRGHSGIKNELGSEFNFVKDDGGKISEETLKLYEDNFLIVPLGVEVITFNTLSEKERKN
jgi:hypothetical protein